MPWSKLLSGKSCMWEWEIEGTNMSAGELVWSFLTEEDLLSFITSPAERRGQTCKELSTPGINENKEDNESRWELSQGSRDMRPWAIWRLWNSRNHKATATELNFGTFEHFLFFPWTTALNFASISEELPLAG